MTGTAAAYGHPGLRFGILGLIVAIGSLYPALNPTGDLAFFLFFPGIFWAIGVLFVVGELYESGRPA